MAEQTDTPNTEAAEKKPGSKAAKMLKNIARSTGKEEASQENVPGAVPPTQEPAQEKPIKKETRSNRPKKDEQAAEPKTSARRKKQEEAVVEKPARQKGFSLRPEDKELIRELQIMCAKAGMFDANQTAIVRAGLQALKKTGAAERLKMVEAAKVKTGRPPAKEQQPISETTKKRRSG